MERFLIIRLSAIGDIVFAAPLISTIRQRYPQAHITWLADTSTAALLEHHPDLDELITWPRAEWKKLWRNGQKKEALKRCLALIKQLRSRNFSHALDTQGLAKSGIWAWLSGAKHRIGLGSREGSQWLMTERLKRNQGDVELFASEYKYIAEHLGCDTSEFRAGLHPGDKAESEARAVIESHNASGGFIAVAPFTTRPQKHWFDDHWRQLFSSLQNQHPGRQIFILGGPADKQHAEKLITAGNIHNLAGATSLQTAMAIVGQASLVIGVDTGLTHMGTAFERPTVAIFGSTLPYAKTAFGSTKVLWLGMPCSPCRRNPTCDGAFTCLRDISASQVMQAAEEVLK